MSTCRLTSHLTFSRRAWSFGLYRNHCGICQAQALKTTTNCVALTKMHTTQSKRACEIRSPVMPGNINNCVVTRTRQDYAQELVYRKHLPASLRTYYRFACNLARNERTFHLSHVVGHKRLLEHIHVGQQQSSSVPCTTCVQPPIKHRKVSRSHVL